MPRSGSAFNLAIATPGELAPPPDLIGWAREGGAAIILTDDPYEAVSGADAVVTDCWVSMGDEEEERIATICSRPIA